MSKENDTPSVAYPVDIDALQKAMGELEEQRAEAIEIARTAIGAIETIYGHAQFCDQCQSFEIAKQCLDELPGFDRLIFLANVEGHTPR